MPVFPLEKFRLLYPKFAAVTDETVLAVAEQALCYTSERGCKCSEDMWLLMVAHLLFMAALDASGRFTPGILSGSTIDKITVSFAMPNAMTPWAFWLNRSPYGQQFSALLSKCAAGGRYIGGSPERAAFRTVGGVFPGRGGIGRWWP